MCALSHLYVKYCRFFAHFISISILDPEISWLFIEMHIVIIGVMDLNSIDIMRQLIRIAHQKAKKRKQQKQTVSNRSTKCIMIVMVIRSTNLRIVKTKLHYI